MRYGINHRHIIREPVSGINSLSVGCDSNSPWAFADFKGSHDTMGGSVDYKNLATGTSRDINTFSIGRNSNAHRSYVVALQFDGVGHSMLSRVETRAVAPVSDVT
jgi:hypothetical protein